MTKAMFALGLALVVGGCGAGAKPEPPPQETTLAGHSEEAHEDIVLTAEAAKIAGIAVGQVRRVPLQSELRVTGTVTNTSQGRAVVTPPVAGQVARFLVQLGEVVQAGQAVAIIQSADLAEAAAAVTQAQRAVIAAHAGVREARAQVDLARGTLRSAQSSLARQRAFARTGAFSQPALQAAQKDLADAESELERGKQDQAVHQAQLERAERLYEQELISRTELEQARLEVATDKIRQNNAERKIELAKATFERERRIASQGLANSREIQTAEAEVRTGHLQVQQAKIRWETARSEVDGANKGLEAARANYRAQAGGGASTGATVTVVAPIGGTVTERKATLGQAVERSSELCVIENLRSVWVSASVPERHTALVRLGSPAQVKVGAYPGRTFPGVVQVVGSRLDPKSRTMPVQVLVDNASGELRAEMFATVIFGVGARRNALAVPRSALVEDAGRRLVYISEEGGKYEERVVETGVTQGNFVEILSGLEVGERVVFKGAFVLKSEKGKADLKGHEH